MKRKRAYSYIRFSSEAQAEGDSFRRQVDLAKSYCEEKGLDLDERLTVADLGVSAFSGDNIRSGALGKFIAGCRSGLIPEGAALVVENLDRLSRQDAWETVALLRELVKTLKIEVHIIGLNMVLVPGKTDDMQLLYVAVSAMRAHEESAVKSYRVRKAYASRLEKAKDGGVILHGTVPWWCHIDKKQQRVVAVKDRAQTLTKIFSMAAEGQSSYQIARTLNKGKVPTYSPRKHWMSFKVRQLILSDSPCGILTTRLRTKRPGPDYSIEGYYPKVIDKELAERAREVLKRNAKGSRGRNSGGELPLNLLRGVVRHKHYSMRFTNHRSGAKDPKTGVKAINSYYEAFDESAENRRVVFTIAAPQLESLIIEGMRELTVSDLVPEVTDVGTDVIAEIQAECIDLENKIKKLVQALEFGGAVSLGKRIGELEAKLSVTQRRLENVSVEKEEKLAASRTVAHSLEEFKSIALAGDNVTRKKLATSLRRMVSRIYVGQPGTNYLDVAGRANAVSPFTHLDPAGTLKVLEDSIIDSPRRRSLEVKVFFATGVMRTISRIGADWELLPKNYINRRDGENFRRHIFITGLARNEAPNFKVEDGVALPVPKEVKIPSWMDEMESMVMKRKSKAPTKAGGTKSNKVRIIRRKGST